MNIKMRITITHFRMIMNGIGTEIMEQEIRNH